MTPRDEIEYLKAENANLRRALELANAPCDIVDPAWGLRPTEAKIFRALTKDRVMPIERIYALIYGGRNSEVDPKGIASWISYMRPKLAAFGMSIKKNYAKTGYELVGFRKDVR